MAWGLEARVPFLDKAFLEVAMGVRPEDKMFNKGIAQEFDEDGCPKMEKYILRKAFDMAPDGKVCREIEIECRLCCLCSPPLIIITHRRSHTYLARSCGGKRSNSRTASATPGSMGAPTDYAFIAPAAHCEDGALG